MSARPHPRIPDLAQPSASVNRSTLADFFLTFAADLDKQHSNLQSEVNSFVAQVGELSTIVKKLKANKKQL